MNLEQRRILKKNLPYGSGKTLARIVGVSEQSISRYFSGVNNSYRIELAAMRLCEKLVGKRNAIWKNIMDATVIKESDLR
jgi:hypothetical protein